MTNNPHSDRIQHAGRPYKPMAERKLRPNGKMLHFPDVPNVEALFSYALRWLAETMDD